MPDAHQFNSVLGPALGICKWIFPVLCVLFCSVNLKNSCLFFRIFPRYWIISKVSPLSKVSLPTLPKIWSLTLSSVLLLNLKKKYETQLSASIYTCIRENEGYDLFIIDLWEASSVTDAWYSINIVELCFLNSTVMHYYDFKEIVLSCGIEFLF